MGRVNGAAKSHSCTSNEPSFCGFGNWTLDCALRSVSPSGPVLGSARSGKPSFRDPVT